MKKIINPNKDSETIILEWIRMIRENEKYYFSKAIDLFSRLPTRHQAALIKHLAEKESQQYWLDNYEDESSYRDVIKSVLFYYSGREKAGDPNKDRFKQELGSFIRSKEFKTVGIKHDASEFTEGLGKL
jgi:hypothetical protein